MPSSRGALLLLCSSVLLSACTADKQDTSDFFDDHSDDEDDVIDPSVTLDAPTAGETVSEIVTWAATASDDDRVESVTFYVDGALVDTDIDEPWGGTWDSTTALNGEHQIAAVARDPAGNTASAEGVVVVSNASGLASDAVVITSPTGDGSQCGTVSVETAVSEEVVQVVFALDGVEVELDTSTPFAWDWDTTLSADGPHTVTATASDADGLSAVDSVTVTVANDDALCDNSPAVTFYEPLEGEYVRGTVDMSVTASDDVGVASVTFYVDSGLLLTDGAVPYETALASADFLDGGHTLKAVATDTAGQTSEAEITIIIDNQAPVLLIDSPRDGGLVSGDLTFSASATDNLGLESVALTLDGALLEAFTAEPFEVEIDSTALDFGAHVLEARAIDRAGNESTDTVRVSVDNPPIITFTEPTDTIIYATATVVAEATDDERVTGMSLYQDGELVDTITGGSDVSTTIDTCELDHGSTIEVKANALDASDNRSSEAITLTVDQPIQVEIDEPTGALDYTATLGASVSDDQAISSVVFALDGVTVATSTRSSGSSEDCFDCGCTLYSDTFSTAAASEGAHTLTVTVTNAAGDVATDSTTVTIDPDHDDDGYDSDFYGGDDCDDEDPTISPSVAETCDGVDNDCDGVEDEDFDVDGDGHLDEGLCADLPGGTDCDDSDATVSPDATESCDGVDEDCDGHIDNSSPWTSLSSTFGTSSDSLTGSGMAGSVYQATTNSTITGFSARLNPGAATPVTWAIYEATSSTGDYTLVDSNTSEPSGSAGWYSSEAFAVDLTSGHYYLLAVGTTASLIRYGDKTPSFASGGGLTVTGYTFSSSIAPTTISTDASASQIYYQRVNLETPDALDGDADADGFSPGCGDCDDSDGEVYPDAAEVCDEIDNDCDGSTDEAEDADGDGDEACTDCDDLDSDSYTGGSEVCDGADNDCDGTVDDDPSDGTSYYTDFDDDGYGRAGGTTLRCGESTGYAAVAGDCDDADATRSPGLSEVCNGEDEDCDGVSDEDFDGDGDGYGAGASCGDNEDCDDDDPAINVDGTETCNSKDDDCDGAVDDDASGGSTYYADSDGDGYGDADAPTLLCSPTSGYSTLSTDCDDALGAVYPGASETCNQRDDDCDGVEDDGFDGDGDGYASCSECDDSDGDVNPAAEDDCEDGLDADCDGQDPWCHLSGTKDMGSTGYKLRGEGSADYAGYRVDASGDQNGDGLADVLIGAYNNDEGATNAGAVYLVPGGSISSSSLGSAPAIKLIGEDASDFLGISLAYVGDQNGDGYDDLLAGGMQIDDGGADAGAALMVLGPTVADLDMSGADARIYGEDPDDCAGGGVGFAGDMNDDGEPDLLVGAHYADDGGSSTSGTVYGVLGPISSSMDLAGADFMIYGVNSSDLLGVELVGNADTDGDGYDDVVLGNQYYGSSDAGAAFVVLGPATGAGKASTMADATLTGLTSDDSAGRGVGFGDVDGDGYADVLVGAPGRTATTSDAGVLAVFLGPVTASGSVSSADFTLSGAEASAGFGAGVSAGDIDEDGIDDLLVGARTESDGGSSAGMAYVFYGPIDGSVTTSSADVSFVGEDASDYFGGATDIGGDMNGDDAPDLVIGAIGEDYSSTSTGSAYVIFQ